MTDALLEQARDRERVFQAFLQQEVGFDAEKLAFLDRGLQASPYQHEIPAYPNRLRTKPDGQTILSIGQQAPLKEIQVSARFSGYPDRGNRPAIDEQRLTFLHPDIQQACLCVGDIVGGQVRAYWAGRHAIANVEFWSATKFIPLLNLVTEANTKAIQTDIDSCLIRNRGATKGYRFQQLATDVISYQQQVATSNALAHMFKLFTTPIGLEQWVKTLTGNSTLTFQGRYGEPPFLTVPELYDSQQRVLLTAATHEHRGQNSISAYDLTRLLSMLGWHHHMSPSARFPGAQWHSLESLVRALGTDSARYVDVALKTLGLESIVRSPVILSKMGFGRSTVRDRTELSYAAFVQFIDTRPNVRKAGVLRTFCFTLLGAKGLNDADQEARELDARMAAEVTEILRRLVTDELV